MDSDTANGGGRDGDPGVGEGEPGSGEWHAGFAPGELDDELIGGDRLDRVLVRELGPQIADVFLRMRRTKDEWHARRHPDEGLRERKKRITRQRISDVATTLFVAQGFENVTVAKVADVVGVSEKTVYNYFPTKESLVFDDADATVEDLARELRESPPSESATRVMLRALSTDIERFAAVPDEAASFLPMFADMVATTPSLRAAWLDHYGRLIEVAMRELAARAEIDPDEPEVIIAARALVGLQEVSYASLVRHARAGVRGAALRDATLGDIERAARLLDTGLWSLNLLAQGLRTQQQLRGAARAAEEARRQVLGALRQARSTWTELRQQAAERGARPGGEQGTRQGGEQSTRQGGEQGTGQGGEQSTRQGGEQGTGQAFSAADATGQSAHQRHAARRAQQAAEQAARRVARGRPPGAGRGPGRGRPPPADLGPDRPGR